MAGDLIEGPNPLDTKADSMAPVESNNSQDVDEQVKIVAEMCKYVDRIVATVGPAEIDVLPPEAKTMIKSMKSKMILFASSTGQRPKSQGNTQVRVESETPSETSHGESQSDDGTGESDSSIRKPRVSPTTVHSSSGKNQPQKAEVVERIRVVNGSIDERLLRALEMLDNRTLPQPEVFDPASGRSLAQFFATFEQYCTHAYRGGDAGWVGELGRFLTGDVHQAFLAHRSTRDSYEDIKRKLLKWYSDSKERRQYGSKALFSKAQLRSGESIRLYAPRLENLYRQAYPRKCVDASSTLREKFMSTIPRRFRRQLKNSMSLTKTMGGVKMTWAQIVTLAGGYEEALTTDDSADEALGSTWNVSCTPRRPHSSVVTDAFTQSMEPESRNFVGYDEYFPRQQALERDPHTYEDLPFRREASSAVFMEDLRPSSTAQAALVKCHHCNRLGHMRSECRRLLGLCLVCGSDRHRVASCPNRRSSRGHSEGRQPSTTPALQKRVRWSDSAPNDYDIERRQESFLPQQRSEQSVRPKTTLGGQFSEIKPLSSPNDDPVAASAHRFSSNGASGEAPLNPNAPEWGWSLRR